MNTKKTIEYTDPETGEILKGSIRQIAKQLGISHQALSKKIKSGNLIMPKIETKTKSGNQKHKKVATKSGNHPRKVATKSQSGNQMATENGNRMATTNPEMATNEPDFALLQRKHQNQMKATPGENHQNKLLPRGKCVLCGKPTYCTKVFNKDTPEQKIIFICFASCNTPAVTHESKPPSHSQMAYLLKYIADNTKLNTTVKKCNTLPNRRTATFQPTAKM